MQEMRAVYIDKFGGPNVLKLGKLPVPALAEDQVLVRVSHAGVNPVDWKIREGNLESLFPHAFPLIPGWDMAGTIETVGANVEQFKPGDKVYAYSRLDTVQHGTYAEFAPADVTAVAHMPTNLSFAEAASIPLAMLTAWQALVEFADIQAGETVLVCAGAGGVGGFAIQIAHYFGTKVSSTASTGNHNYVKSLGAAVAIDYNTEEISEVLRSHVADGVDIVFDCTGRSDIEENFACVRKGGGRVISICGLLDVIPLLESKGEEVDVKAGLVFVTPDGQSLCEITQLIEQGHLKPLPIEEYPLAEAMAAQLESEKGHVCGKLVLRI
ncbi:MAG: NADP-dependent oxidoreductase [Proteobacteria bacterium]|nr:NADP-dependent oxidoreductase [Pseudomonadota bacterium]